MRSDDRDTPVIISAFGGDPYYYGAADRLRSDCVTLGLEHEIVEWTGFESLGWIGFCRKKVQFYREALLRHRRPVFWVDVDARFTGRPDFAMGCRSDFGGFLREYRYFSDFDPVQAARTFVPSFLYFGYSPAALAFVDRICAIEASTDALATDDYFLEEAWRSHSEQMNVAIFAPKNLSFPGRPAHPDATLVVGRSGKVSTFRKDVVPHAARNLDLRRQTQVLKALASSAKLAGDDDGARRMLRSALAVDPADESVAVELTKLAPKSEVLEETRAVLGAEANGWRRPIRAKQRLADVELEHGDRSVAKRLCEDMIGSDDAAEKGFARARLHRIALEDRADVLGLKRSQRPMLWWRETALGELGDALNPYVVEKLTGLPPVRVSRGARNLLIGPTARFARAGANVWGAGAGSADDELPSGANYLAVRGPMTRARAIAAGATCPEVFGDAAAFMPFIYRPTIATTHRLGLMGSLSRQIGSIATEGVRLIDTDCFSGADIEAAVDAMLSCERIISTTLYGVVLAHAYGLPAEWATVHDGASTFEFYDYFGSVGLAPHEPINLSGAAVLTGKDADGVKRRPDRPIDARQLAACAPFRLANLQLG